MVSTRRREEPPLGLVDVGGQGEEEEVEEDEEEEALFPMDLWDEMPQESASPTPPDEGPAVAAGPSTPPLAEGGEGSPTLDPPPPPPPQPRL